jgi:hypothetical protein
LAILRFPSARWNVHPIASTAALPAAANAAQDWLCCPQEIHHTFLPFAAGGDDVGGAVAFPLNNWSSVGTPAGKPVAFAATPDAAAPDVPLDPLLQAVSKIAGTATPTATAVRRRNPTRTMEPPEEIY